MTLVLMLISSLQLRPSVPGEGPVEPISPGGYRVEVFASESVDMPPALIVVGVLYLAEDPLTRGDLARVFSPQALEFGLFTYQPRFFLDRGLLNVCLALGPSGSSWGALGQPLLLTHGRDYGRGLEFTVMTWPDWTYSWRLAEVGGVPKVWEQGGERGYAWTASHVSISSDPSVTLDTCAELAEERLRALEVLPRSGPNNALERPNED